MMWTWHAASVEESVPLPYRCDCGWEGTATVEGAVGSGTEGSPMGVFGDAVRSRAHSVATKRAVKDAKTTLGLVACPECGQRRTARLVLFSLLNGVLVAIPTLLFVAPIVFFASKGVLFSQQGLAWFCVTGLILGGLAFRLYRRSFGRHLVGGAERVSFRKRGEKSAAREAREVEQARSKPGPKKRRAARRPPQH
jgi:predicted RNA-binding Zn-ribbon protein involved in translation (DUF1610 family)